MKYLLITVYSLTILTFLGCKNYQELEKISDTQNEIRKIALELALYIDDNGLEFDQVDDLSIFEMYVENKAYIPDRWNAKNDAVDFWGQEYQITLKFPHIRITSPGSSIVPKESGGGEIYVEIYYQKLGASSSTE